MQCYGYHGSKSALLGYPRVATPPAAKKRVHVHTAVFHTQSIATLKFIGSRRNINRNVSKNVRLTLQSTLGQLKEKNVYTINRLINWLELIIQESSFQSKTLQTMAWQLAFQNFYSANLHLTIGLIKAPGYSKDVFNPLGRCQEIKS